MTISGIENGQTTDNSLGEWCHTMLLFVCRGHGTYVDEEKLTASVAGEVQRVDKLICVRPLKTR